VLPACVHRRYGCLLQRGLTSSATAMRYYGRAALRSVMAMSSTARLVSARSHAAPTKVDAQLAGVKVCSANASCRPPRVAAMRRKRAKKKPAAVSGQQEVKARRCREDMWQAPASRRFEMLATGEGVTWRIGGVVGSE